MCVTIFESKSLDKLSVPFFEEQKMSVCFPIIIIGKISYILIVSFDLFKPISNYAIQYSRRKY